MEKENSIRCTTVYAGNFSWTSFRPRLYGVSLVLETVRGKSEEKGKLIEFDTLEVPTLEVIHVKMKSFRLKKRCFCLNRSGIQQDNEVQVLLLSRWRISLLDGR